jgi:hypothetical protein
MSVQEDLAELASLVEHGSYDLRPLEDVLRNLEWAAAKIGRRVMVNHYAISLKHHFALVNGRKRSDGNTQAFHRHHLLKDAFMIRNAFGDVK